MLDVDQRRRLAVAADHLTFHACWLGEGYTAGELLFLQRIVAEPEDGESELRLPERVELEELLAFRGWRRELRMTDDAGIDIALLPPAEAVADSSRRLEQEPDDCRQCWLEGRYDDPETEETQAIWRFG